MDDFRRAHTEVTCAKENPSAENRSDFETHRRCYSAKSVQSWIIARFTSTGLKGVQPSPEKPGQWQGFLVVQLSRKRHKLFGASNAVRVESLRTEKFINGLFTCESEILALNQNHTRSTRSTPMSDGKRYYQAFPDEDPKRPRGRSLLDALQKLEAQFRKHITQFRVDQSDRKVGNAHKWGRTYARDWPA